MNTRNWIKFIALSMIWGTSFLWIRVAVKDIGPYLLVFFRMIIAFLGVVVYVIIRKVKIKFTWRKLAIFLFLGFFNLTLPFIMVSKSELWITSGMTSVLNSMYPLFTVIFSLIFLPEERITWLRSVGILIGFGGVVVLASTGFGKGGSSDVIKGIIAMLIASVCYGISLIFAKKMTKGLNPGEQSAGQIGMAVITISIATVLFEPHLRLPAPGITWFALVWLGLLGSAAATILWYSLLNSVGPTRTSLVGYVFPVIAVVLGIIFLQEDFSWQLVVGGIMVIGGVIWVNYIRPFNKPAIVEQENSVE